MIGTILGFTGVLATLAFGIYQIWVYKRKKRIVSIEFKSKECYSLFSDDVRRLNIEVSYNKEPISSALILLKAQIINNGLGDIDRNRIYKPLKIISSNEFKWLESRITFQPPGATTNIELITQNEIQIDWDLLKSKEFIEIEALIEIKDHNTIDEDKAVNFLKGITFDYRITDLNSIHKQDPILRDENEFKYRFLKTVATAVIGVGLLIVILSFVPVSPFFSEKRFEYVISIDSTKTYGSLLITKKDSIEVIISNTNEKTKMTIKEFNEGYKIERIDKIIDNPDKSKETRLFGLIYSLLGALMLGLNSKRFKKLIIKKRQEQNLNIDNIVKSLQP